MNRYFAAILICFLVLTAGVRFSYASEVSISKPGSSTKEVIDLMSRSRNALKNEDYKLVTLLTSQLLNSEINQDTQLKALFMRGKAYTNLKKYDKAIGAYSTIINSIHSGIDQALALSLRAEVYEKSGKVDQAVIDRDRIALIMS